MTTPANVVKFIGSNDIKWVDVQFIDLYGNMHRYTVPGNSISEESFEKGIDGPNVSEVYSEYGEKELILKPDAKTFARVPWENSLARVMATVNIAASDERYLGDPRHITEHMETNLKAAGITSARISAEVEFYIFDNVVVDKNIRGNSASYVVESREGIWNPSPFTNPKGLYMNQPFDTSPPIRMQIAETLSGTFNCPVKYHSHGKGGSCQQKIAVGPSVLKESADAFSTLKYVSRNASFLTNSVATFMPLPLSTEKGSSMIIGQNVWKKDRNVFYDATDKYTQLSQNGMYYIGGILEHAHAICAFANPTVNSYKRLRMDRYYVAWSKYSNGSMIYVPHIYENRDFEKKISMVSGDPSMNPYLAYSVIIAAGLDGIKNKIDPGKPVDGNIENMNAKERKENKIKTLPGSLMEALEALQSDDKFLKGILPSEMLSAYMDMKLEEITSIENSVTPQEFEKYFNI
ncbi:MAG: glutamine synthetase beta-grasp domain-containing protein [Candidatus ainarchaeum sp.]|nr:glutamine synthetase beta-grasp domain-containing protein [Candidatus ainarchaeum sp.]